MATGNLSLVDALPDRDRRLQRRAEIARARHAGQQQLFGRRRHDDGTELIGVGLVPVRVVAVPAQHEVHVHIPEAGQHAHAVGGDHLCAGRHRKRIDGADGGDPLTFDEDDAVADRPSAVAIDQRAADQRFHLGVRRRKCRLCCWWCCRLYRRRLYRRRSYRHDRHDRRHHRENPESCVPHHRRRASHHQRSSPERRTGV